MKISICIPCYNQEKIIRETVESALSQAYYDKEILVIDDCSTDRTAEIVKEYPVRLIVNEKNLGFTGNFNKLIQEYTGDAIVFLCGDDIFTNEYVISDIVEAFIDQTIGVVGRYYYQYLDGYKGPVMTIRDEWLSFCNPSGIAFRKEALEGKKVGDNIFTEIPNLVKDVLNCWYKYIIKYDTMAARLHPGPKGNAATNPDYYIANQSIIKNWNDVIGKPFVHSLGLIQLKNRFPKMLWTEIKMSVKCKPSCLINPMFLACAFISLTIPGCILRPFSMFYRHRITRLFVKEITQNEVICDML